MATMILRDKSQIDRGADEDMTRTAPLYCFDRVNRVPLTYPNIDIMNPRSSILLSIYRGEETTSIKARTPEASMALQYLYLAALHVTPLLGWVSRGMLVLPNPMVSAAETASRIDARHPDRRNISPQPLRRRDQDTVAIIRGFISDSDLLISIY